MTIPKHGYNFFLPDYAQRHQSAEERSNADITDTDCHPHSDASVLDSESHLERS